MSKLLVGKNGPIPLVSIQVPGNEYRVWWDTTTKRWTVFDYEHEQELGSAPVFVLDDTGQIVSEVQR